MFELNNSHTSKSFHTAAEIGVTIRCHVIIYAVREFRRHTCPAVTVIQIASACRIGPVRNKGAEWNKRRRRPPGVAHRVFYIAAFANLDRTRRVGRGRIAIAGIDRETVTGPAYKDHFAIGIAGACVGKKPFGYAMIMIFTRWLDVRIVGIFPKVKSILAQCLNPPRAASTVRKVALRCRGDRAGTGARSTWIKFYAL